MQCMKKEKKKPVNDKALSYQEFSYQDNYPLLDKRVIVGS